MKRPGASPEASEPSLSTPNMPPSGLCFRRYTATEDGDSVGSAAARYPTSATAMQGIASRSGL